MRDTWLAGPDFAKATQAWRDYILYSMPNSKEGNRIIECIASGCECRRRLGCMLLAKSTIWDFKGPSPYLADTMIILIIHVTRSVKLSWKPLTVRASTLVSSWSLPVAQYILVWLPLPLLGTFIRRLFEVLRVSERVSVGRTKLTRRWRSSVGCISVCRRWMCGMECHDNFGALFGLRVEGVGYLRVLR